MSQTTLEQMTQMVEQQEALYNEMLENLRVPAIKTGVNNITNIEELLMKLSMAETVIESLCAFVECVERDGELANNLPPDQWAISGAFKNIHEVAHALKSLCWGHAESYSH